MEIIIENPAKAETFVNIFQHLKVFTEHINLQFNSSGLYIQGLDSSHVSIFIVQIPASWFDTYQCEKGLVLGINTNIFAKVLKSREISQKIAIQYNEESEQVFVKFTAAGAAAAAEDSLAPPAPKKKASKKKSSAAADEVPAPAPAPAPPLTAAGAKKVLDMHFQIPLVEIDCETLEIPEVDYNAELSMESDTFHNMINQLKTFGDNLDILCSETLIKFSSKNESGALDVPVKIDELGEFSINEGEELNISFALSYCYNFSLFYKLSKEVRLSFSNEYPMKLCYNMGNCMMTFYLAPKIMD